MLKSKYILFAVFLLAAAGVSAQKAERDYIRKGNHLFNDSVFVDAEVNYRKALEANPKSTVSMYNLGNTLSQQQKFQDAMEQYVSASKIEKDKMKLAHIYHNMGVIFQAGKDYADHETRYNLALAQKMLKDQQNQQNQDQNQDQNKDQQKQDQKQDQNKDKQKDQKQDEKKDQQQPPKSEKKQDNQMSKENAEQLLNSVMQDEKDVQDKVKKQQKVMQGGRLEKDW